jgi:type IV pilus assembly protein PilO
MNLSDINSLNLKDIATAPAPVQVLILSILLAALVFAGYWFDWSPKMDELRMVEDKEQQLRNTFLTKKRQAINLDLYKQQLKDIEKTFGALLRQLPNKAEMDALITDINQAGLGRGLEFELFRPGNETVKEFYAELPISIKVTGSYHDIGAFASDAAQLSRIVTVHDIVITPRKDDRLNMDATVRTYRYLDEEEIAAQKKPESGKGPQKKARGRK